jgi:hypothetical protein
VGQDDEDQQATHFDRKFSIPPCPAVVTYNPVPAISFNDDEADDLHQNWKEIKLLNGTSILARRVSSLNCPFDRPDHTFSLLPLFTMQNIRDFSARLNDDLYLKLSRAEEHHARDLKETIDRLESKSACTVQERDSLKEQVQTARGLLNEMQLDLARVRNASQSVNNGPPPVGPQAPPVVVPPVIAPFPPVIGAATHSNHIENIEKHLKSLSSTVHYLQRCHNHSTVQQSRAPPMQYYLNLPPPDYQATASGMTSDHALQGPPPVPNPIGPVYGNSVPRNRNNRNRNRNRKRNANRNATPNTEPAGIGSVQSSPAEQHYNVNFVPGPVNGRGGGGGGAGRGLAVRGVQATGRRGTSRSDDYLFNAPI